MKINIYLAPLIRASLDNDIKTVRAITMKIIRNLRQSNPELAHEISEALSYHGSGLPSTRSIGYTSSPQDSESRIDLLRVVEPVDSEMPFYNNTIEEVIDFIKKEREMSTKLLKSGLSPVSTLLLHGSPGVGKTYLANHLASSFKLKFACLDMSSAVSSYLGKTGQNLKKVLDYAKEEPTLLLLDEFDAIAKKRDDSTDLGELKRVVNVLLKELEDWPSHSFLVAATNHPELLDRAIWRRFDIELEVPLPNTITRKRILSKELEGFDMTISLDLLAALTKEMTPAELVKVCNHCKKQFLIYEKNLDISIISELGSMNRSRGTEFNKMFCKLARSEFGMTYREMAKILDKSVSSIQHYLK